jgi:hypothetical protein
VTVKGRTNHLWLALLAGLLGAAPAVASPAGDVEHRFGIELEAGPAWQAKNDVQIPNTELGTRFSLKDLVGKGPWPTGRVYVTWNINGGHSLRGLFAPFSYTETGSLDRPASFADESYEAGVPTEATYRFNSWRLSYRYRLVDSDPWRVWIGLSTKIRDAKIELRQGQTTSLDDDLGFVPLLHFAADRCLAGGWHATVDVDGLAGGPGRAIDLALKLGYDVSPGWRVSLGYRALEGGADVEDVYSFAWFNWVTVSVAVDF